MKVCLLVMMFLVFLTQKLTGITTWSWWWVTAPLWSGFVLFGVLKLITLLIQIFECTNE